MKVRSNYRIYFIFFYILVLEVKKLCANIPKLIFSYNKVPRYWERKEKTGEAGRFGFFFISRGPWKVFWDSKWFLPHDWLGFLGKKKNMWRTKNSNPHLFGDKMIIESCMRWTERHSLQTTRHPLLFEFFKSSWARPVQPRSAAIRPIHADLLCAQPGFLLLSIFMIFSISIFFK